MRGKIICALALWAVCFVSVPLAHAQSQKPVDKSTAASSASPSPAATPEKDQEVREDELVRIKTSLVTVPAIVVDRSGKYISDLRREDFRIFEDGIEQQIAFFASVEAPATVVLMLDVSDSTRFKIEDIQKAAIAFIEKLRSDDQAMIVSFDQNINVLARRTADKNSLRQAILKSRTGGGTRLYDAVDYAVNELLASVKGRKVCVLFSDGVDTESRSLSYAQSLYNIEESGVPIYPIRYDTYINFNQPEIDSMTMDRQMPVGRMSGTRTTVELGRGSSLKDHVRGKTYLNELAKRTGTHLYQADNLKSLSQAFADIAEELRWHYSLGYYPKVQAEKGQRRQIKVIVNRPKVIVRTRTSYISN